MTLAELEAQVRDIIDDPGKFRYSDTVFAFDATEASLEIVDALSLPSERDTSLSLVEDQKTYVLPADITRVVAIRLIPENGGNPGGELDEVLRAELPVVDDLTNRNLSDPKRYALISGEGTNEDQLMLVFEHAPRRSASNAIVIDYQIQYEFDGSADFATQNVPFPARYNYPMVHMTAGLLLKRSDDAADKARGESLFMEGKDRLGERAMLNSLSFWQDNYRSMP